MEKLRPCHSPKKLLWDIVHHAKSIRPNNRTNPVVGNDGTSGYSAIHGMTPIHQSTGLFALQSYNSHVPTVKENLVHVVNVRQLKSNPSTALRDARGDMVVVMNRDKPDALMIGFEQLAGVPDFAHVRQAMAVNLFKDRLVSVASAAKIADESMATMLTRLGRLGIAVVDYDEPALAQEVASAAAWAQSAP
jgi:predicted HTH domain antitoxin